MNFRSRIQKGKNRAGNETEIKTLVLKREKWEKLPHPKSFSGKLSVNENKVKIRSTHLNHLLFRKLLSSKGTCQHSI